VPFITSSLQHRRTFALVGLAFVIILALSFYQSGQEWSKNLAAKLKSKKGGALELPEYAFPENPRILKVTVFYGEGMLYKGSDEDVSQEILQGHSDHALRHGHKQIIQRQNLMETIYTKPAAILSILLQELQKPEEKRAEWIL
jgi:hypothetical protein